MTRLFAKVFYLVRLFAISDEIHQLSVPKRGGM